MNIFDFVKMFKLCCLTGGSKSIFI